MSAANRSAGIVIGGEPRIDFLPPEVKSRNAARKSRRSLAALVVIVLVACAAGYVFATTLAVQSQAMLAEEQAHTRELLAEQAKYSEVRTVTSATAAVENARIVGSATEVVWADYLAELQASLPAGATIETFTVDSQAAFEAVPEASVPLQHSRVATIAFTVRVSSLPVADALLVSVRELNGYAGAAFSTIGLEDGTYLANGVLLVNSDALAKRFFEPAEADSEATEGSETGSDDQPVEGGE